MTEPDGLTAIEMARSRELEGGRRKLKGEVAFRCPFDEKKRFKLYINEQSNVWHCQHCKQGGKGAYTIVAFFLGLKWPHDAKEIQFWIRKCTSAIDRFDTPKVLLFSRSKAANDAAESSKIKINRSGPTLITKCYKVITLLPLAEKLGRNKADILERIHFWCYFHRKDELRQTVTQFCSQFPWIAERTMKKEIAELEQQGLLISRKQGNDKFYRVNHTRLQELFAESPAIEITDNSSPSERSAPFAPLKGNFCTPKSRNGGAL